MAVNLSMLAGAGAQFFDNSGVILSGGLIYTYAAGTTTPQAAYTTSAGNVAHANPIVLNSAGRVASGGEIWLTDAIAYKFVLQTSAAVTIATYDNVTGNASGVAANVTAGIYSTFAASSGSSLVGYTQGNASAVATTVQAKLRQYVSVFDFMTAADQVQVVARNQTAGAPDVTYALQNAIDATPKGGQLRIPNGLYRHTGLTVVQGIEIVGDTPPDLWDNDSTIVLNGGTVLWNSNIAGNNLTVQPPNLGDRRLRFHIQDVLLLGALWTGSAFVTSGSGYSGHGLYVNGRSGAGIETAVELSWERLSCSFNADHGIFLTGSIYNGECGHAWLYKNGKNNFRIEATGEPIGEMTFRQLSCFIGGSKTGATGYDTANVYIVSGGCINIGLLSSTGSVGTPVVLAGGRYNIGIIWSEGGGGTSDANSIVVEFGNGSSNPSGAEISFIVANPGDNYLGKIVLFRTYSKGCHIGQVLVDAAGLTNTLVEFQTDADGHTVKRLSGSTTGTEIVDAGNNNTYSNLFSVRSAYTKRGLWTPTNLAVGKENSSNVTSGSVGHGLFSDGTANLSASSSDAGGIAYLACNNNAAVADGYKFFSFRIGTTPSEIGKIAVASSGTAINYATSSDYRLKENPQPMTDALDRICQLKPVTFTWKSKQILGEGFLAHELQQVFPAAVTGEKDQVGIDNEPLYQGVDASKIVAALVSAVQELTERIKVLEGK